MSRQKAKGFSLVEISIAMVLTAMLVSGIYGLVSRQEKGLAAQKLLADVQASRRFFLYLLERDLSRAGGNPSAFLRSQAPAPAALAEAGPDFLHLQSDLNGDNDLADADEDITYQYLDADGDGVPETVKRADAAGGTPLVLSPVAHFELTYVTAGGQAVARPDPPSLVRQVRIHVELLSARPDPLSGQPLKESLDQTVKLQNLMS